MAYSITQFENNLQNSLVALDNNFVTFGALVPIPCSVSGSNTLTLTQNAAGLVPAPTISAYSENMLFTGIAAANNTGPVTATIGSTGALNVYNDTQAGPVLCIGGELIGGCAFALLYDPALNSGAGGFHLIANTAVAVSPLNPGGNATLTNLFSGNSPTLTFTATPGWASQDQAFSVTAALPSTLPAVGDFVLVNPSSLGASGVDFRGFILGTGSFSVSLGSASFSEVFTSTVNIRLLNAASASLASNSGIYRYVAQRFTP